MRWSRSTLVWFLECSKWFRRPWSSWRSLAYLRTRPLRHFFALSNLGLKLFSFTDHFFALGSYRFMFGLPIAGVAAAAIVSVFQTVAPSHRDADGNLS